MIVYTAESSSQNLKQTCKTMIGNLRKSIYPGYRIFLKDIRGEYSKSKFGIFWDFVEPLAFAAVFIWLYKSRSVTVSGLDIPYAAYISCGLLLWQVFVDSILFPLGVIEKSKSLITHVKIPPESLIFNTTFRIYFYAALRIIVLIVILVFLRQFSLVGFFKFIIFFPILTLMGTGLGLLLAPFNTIYNDISKFIKIFLRPLMFISGVVFPIPSDGLLATFSKYNPIAMLIETYRALLTTNHLIPISLSFVVTILIILCIGWFVFHASIRVITERI